MKTAVIFYSFNGNCELVAEEIKTLIGADLIRLYSKDEKKRSRIGKFFWSFSMVMRKNPPLKPYTFDAAVYDLIVIGAPVWGGSPASPIRTFISESGLTGKKIALFVSHAGGMGNAIEKFKVSLAGNEIIAEAEFKDPVKGRKERIKKKIAEWVKTFN